MVGIKVERTPIHPPASDIVLLPKVNRFSDALRAYRTKARSQNHLSIRTTSTLGYLRATAIYLYPTVKVLAVRSGANEAFHNYSKPHPTLIASNVLPQMVGRS